MSSLASELGIYLVVPVPTEDRQGRPHSSLIAFDPSGRTAGHHHKVELYSSERDEFVAGTSFGAFETPWGRAVMMLCSDAYAEPVTQAALADPPATLVLLSSLWTVDGAERWQAALAHDWQVPVVAANGAGGRGRGSGIYSPDGVVLASERSNQNTVLVAALEGW